MVIDPNSNINSQNLGANKARQQQELKSNADTPKQDAKPASVGDNVSLSNASRAIASLENRVLDAPDIDASRVAELKQAIDSGSYSVNAEAIADKILVDDTQLG